MLPAEIILIIIGFVSISLSFFIANKNNDADGEDVGSKDIWTKKDEETIIKHVDEILSERGLELVDTTEDQMNRICNEKIMAFDEFSKQVLEKINANHDEVVFMYNMLDEKKKEILKETMRDTVEKSVPVISEAKDTDTENVIVNTLPGENTGLNRAKRKAETVIVPSTQKSSGEEEPHIYTTDRPVKSGMDISKEMNLGQGEVKLMIALLKKRS